MFWRKPNYSLLCFIDLDGVCNDHTKHLNGYCGTTPDCVTRLNEILAITGAKIVISSAWRYLVLGKSMTLKGFEYMLLTHGVLAKNRVVGVTRKDTMIWTGDKRHPVANERGQQITDWRRRNRHLGSYLVLDDLDLGISELHPFVRTEGSVGLTPADVRKAVEHLMGSDFCRGYFTEEALCDERV